MDSKNLKDLQKFYLKICEQQVLDPKLGHGLELPFRSVDGLIRGSAATNIPNLPANIERSERIKRRYKDLQVRNNTKNTTTQLAHYDLFDIIKGYLLDEGYAETLEAAESIMMNMSESWMMSIIDTNQR